MRRRTVPPPHSLANAPSRPKLSTHQYPTHETHHSLVSTARYARAALRRGSLRWLCCGWRLLGRPWCRLSPYHAAQHPRDRAKAAVILLPSTQRPHERVRTRARTRIWLAQLVDVGMHAVDRPSLLQRLGAAHADGRRERIPRRRYAAHRHAQARDVVGRAAHSAGSARSHGRTDGWHPDDSLSIRDERRARP